MRNSKSDRGSLIDLLNIPFSFGLFSFFSWLDYPLIATGLLFGGLVCDHFLGGKGPLIPEWIVVMSKTFRLLGMTLLFSFCALIAFLFFTNNMEKMEPRSMMSALSMFGLWLGVSMITIGEFSTQMTKTAEQDAPDQPLTR